MNADDVIESYVRDVAACLPRAKRNDVAFELRALLADELADRAEAEGRAPDKTMAMALLKGFGRPAEAARRYHETPAVIDPADTHHFLIWTLGGAVTLGVLSLLKPGEIDSGDLFLKWLGVLVLVFAGAAWLRRRRPQAFGWKPNRSPDFFPRSLALLSLVATLVFPVFMYAAPQTFVHTAFLGVVSDHGVALTDAFRHSALRLTTLALLVASAALYAVILIQGGVRRWTQLAGALVQLGLGSLSLAHAALIASDHGSTMQVFVLPAANTTAGPFFGSVGALCLLGGLYEAYRAWARISPAPKLA